MNHAHFTISFSTSFYSKGDSEISGNVNSLSLGMGIFHGWMFLMAIGASDVFPAIASSTEGPSQLFLSFSLVFSLALLFIAFTNQKFLHFYVSKQALVVCTILAALGTVLIMMSTFVGDFGLVLLNAAGLVTGLGSALMIVLWGVAFSRYEMETVVLNTALATAISIIIYLLVVSCNLHPLSWTLCFLMPIFSVLLLWKQTPIAYYLRNEIPIFHPLKVNQFSFSLRFGIPVILFGAGLSAVRFVCLGRALPKADLSSQLLVVFGTIVGLTLVASTAILVHKGSHWDRVFRTLIPFAALGTLSFAVPVPSLEPLAHFILVIGYLCFESLLWIYFSDLSEEFRISPLFLFGLGRSLMGFAGLASIVLIFGLDASAIDYQTSAKTVAALLLFLIVLGSSLLPRHREIWPIIMADKSHDDVYLALEEKASATKAKGTSCSPAGDAQGVGSEGGGAREVPDEEGVRSKGRFRARCEEIADQYMLSRRETEVMFLLAKGHNATYIQEKLFISKSTTKTHMNHIYRKLNIHTQQELLCMVEATDESSAAETRAIADSSPDISTETREGYRLQADIFAPHVADRNKRD